MIFGATRVTGFRYKYLDLLDPLRGILFAEYLKPVYDLGEVVESLVCEVVMQS